MNQSEALTKSWMMSKIERLERIIFDIDMKDRWDSEDRRNMDNATAELNAIKNALYPKSEVVKTVDELTAEKRAELTAELNELNQQKNKDMKKCGRVVWLEDYLSKTLMTWTSMVLDETAYDAA